MSNSIYLSCLNSSLEPGCSLFDDLARLIAVIYCPQVLGKRRVTDYVLNPIAEVIILLCDPTCSFN
jgi:hypothetical protein